MYIHYLGEIVKLMSNFDHLPFLHIRIYINMYVYMCVYIHTLNLKHMYIYFADLVLFEGQV